MCRASWWLPGGVCGGIWEVPEHPWLSEPVPSRVQEQAAEPHRVPPRLRARATPALIEWVVARLPALGTRAARSLSEPPTGCRAEDFRSEEHTSELQSL